MKKPWVDPFPNLPRRFGSYREVETKPVKVAAETAAPKSKSKPKRIAAPPGALAQTTSSAMIPVLKRVAAPKRVRTGKRKPKKGKAK